MLLIYTEILTPRNEYVFDFIFNDVLGIAYRVITDKESFRDYNLEKINYSQSRITDELFIKREELLFEHTIKNEQVPAIKKDGLLSLFPTQDSDMGFDIFAATFYMISRYEEYLTFTADKYGRFSSGESLAVKCDFLQKPIVNLWINKLKNILKGKYPSIQYKEQEFKAIFTYDIDVAYAYKGRSLLRNIRSMVKDMLLLNFKNITARIKVLNGSKEDPWDIYNPLKQVLSKNKLHSIFFFLMGDYAKNDKSLGYQSKAMKDVIADVSSFAEIGIHPSFKSNGYPKKLQIEKKRLEDICNKKIFKSRQHFLKFKLPDTYNHLIAAGIGEDFSMGFADMPGFRAGTCTPFYFYDLIKEKVTPLKIYPATCMDANFIHYSAFNSSESLQIILNLLHEVKIVGGIFISIWHNNYLTMNKYDNNWIWVHDEVIKKISEVTNSVE